MPKGGSGQTPGHVNTGYKTGTNTHNQQLANVHGEMRAAQNLRAAQEAADSAREIQRYRAKDSMNNVIKASGSTIPQLTDADMNATNDLYQKLNNILEAGPNANYNNNVVEAVTDLVNDRATQYLMDNVNTVVEATSNKTYIERIKNSLFSTNAPLKKLGDSYANLVKQAPGTAAHRAAVQQYITDLNAYKNSSGNQNISFEQMSENIGKEIAENPDFDQLKKNLNQTKSATEAIKNDSNNPKEGNPWMGRLGMMILLASIIGFPLLALFYKNAKTGCWIWFGSNNSMKLLCNTYSKDDFSFKTDKNYYQKDNGNHRYLCSCGGGKAFKPATYTDVDLSDIKINGTITGDDPCADSDFQMIRGAPYAVGRIVTYNGTSCPALKHSGDYCGNCNCSAPGGGIFQGGTIPYCRGTGAGENDFYYAWREGSIWDLGADIIDFLGDFLGGGLNFILKWVLIIMGVILGGALVFFIAKQLIASKPLSKKESHNENIKIELDTHQNPNTYQQNPNTY